MAGSSDKEHFDELYLWYLAEPQTPQLVGTLNLMNIGNGVSLRYAQSWLKSGFPLSEDLPLVDTLHMPRARAIAAGAVDDARPDRWGERVIEFIEKPSRLSLMEYLYYAGDDRFGALGVSRVENAYLPHRTGPLPRIGNAQQLSEIVAKINARQPVTEIEKRLISAGGSFGGAKPKALIDIDGIQWVIKFFNNEPVDVPLIEHATMTLCRKAGINAAQTQLIRLKGENAVAVRRFDRNGTSRIHCLSAGTALRATVSESEQADLSYPNLAQLLRRSGETTDGANRQQMAELFRRMVFNILIDNTDDHEKNHTVLLTREPAKKGSAVLASRLKLAPAYDVLPTNSGQGRQEFGVGADGRDSTLSNALSRCHLFGLDLNEASKEIARVIVVIDTWKDHFREHAVTDADIDELAQRIDGQELLSQRRNFNDATSPAKGRGPSRQT